VATSKPRYTNIVPKLWKVLKEAITQEVAAIPHEMTHRVMEKYRERLNHCIDNEGRHLSDVVFKF
jgi:long-subunit acyl-CoA synthetase (AMP-forming)